MSEWNEALIARAISIQLLNRKCVVLIPNCSWPGNECDVLGLTTDLRIIDVEVKISRADFKADAKKEKWWHRLTFDEKQAAGLKPGTDDFWDAKEPAKWPSNVWKHYYALPAEIWKPEMLEFLPSQTSGVLLLSKDNRASSGVVIRCIKNAKPNKDAHRVSAEKAIDIARLANIRMWEAYAKLERMAA
jgi:hypothetical protein